MAGLKRKVREWQDAGLITTAQADSIFSYEKDRKTGKFGRGLTFLGIFAILVGILSIVASHWMAIPAAVKIGLHLLLNIAVAAAAWTGARDGRDMLREGAALALFFLTLTLMALIGQVYQLDGTFTGLTAGWMIITLPFIAFFGRHYMTAIPWMLALLVTIGVAMAENLDQLPEFWQEWFFLAVATLLPLALIGDGNLKIFHDRMPVYADTFRRTGFVLLTLSASIFCSYWNVDDSVRIGRTLAEADLTQGEATLYLAALFLAALTGVVVRALVSRFFIDDALRRYGVPFCVVSILMIAVPVLLPAVNSPVAAALAFIAYWIFIGWLGQQLVWSRLISLAIVLVALRILAIYIEVFGTMLDTGVGLIIGGAVVLGLIYAARRMNKRLTGGLHG